MITFSIRTVIEFLKSAFADRDDSTQDEMQKDESSQMDEPFEDESDVYIAVDTNNSQLGNVYLYKRQGNRVDTPFAILPKDRDFTKEELLALFDRLHNKSTASHSAQEQIALQETATRLFAPLLTTQKFPELASDPRVRPLRYASDWLSDRHINHWFDHLASKYKDKKIGVIHSGWGTAYIKELAKNGPMKQDRARLRKADLIFWPLHHVNHWYLMVIERKGNDFDIQCLDGLNDFARHPAYFTMGINLVESLFDDVDPDERIISTESIKIPRQNNFSDCGAVIGYYAEKKCQGQDLRIYRALPDHSCDYEQARVPIAQVLARQSPKKILDGSRVRQGKRVYSPDSPKPPSSPTRKMLDLTLDEEEVSAGRDNPQETSRLRRRLF